MSLAAITPACGGDPWPSVDCHQVVWWRPAHTTDEVRVIGSWDGWQTPGIAAEPAEDGWKGALLTLPPGEHGYLITVNGAPRLDKFQPLTTFRGEQEVSLLIADDCSVPALHIEAAEADADGALHVAGTFLAHDRGPAIAPASLTVGIDGEPAKTAQPSATAATGAFTINASGLAPGKHTITIDAQDAGGKAAERARASVWVKPVAETWSDAVLYQIVVDRYRGDGGTALAAPPTPGTRAGGTLAGVTAEIEKGTFAALGVSALWISPVYTNPDEFRIGRDGHLSQGYHGYWPVADREVDPHLGGEAALDALIASAHAHGLRVLFDLVPNHVYETNPRYTAHQSDGWFDDGPDHCICGDPGCDWGAHIERCWFTSFLPDVRWESDAAMNATVADTLFWMDRFDADGVRIDAVPMMPRLTTRRILRAMRDHVAPRSALFSVGEVFTGPGGIDSIKFHMGPDGLDSAFDFPLMWSLRDAIASNRAGLDAIASTLDETDTALRGSGAVMARMLGNHDTTRFLSEAAGNAGNDAWANPPPQPTSAGPYVRQRLATALIFALPGMPVIYYGDEIGLAGASDPDSRRVMPSLDALSEEQQKTLALTKRLGQLRRCLPSLRTGARVPVWADGTTLAFARDSGDGVPALALFSTAQAQTKIAVPGGVVPPGDYVDALSGEAVTLAGGDAIPIDPLTAKILVPSTSPCLSTTP
ncbi:MAG: alpha-amylase family glycosyl hydrolase [Minicystis sp.]